ncbi:putative nucleolar complex protein 3-like [Apostichopus japonicus]|uniref:NOC3-like protein n=1 Tax=Stichopus japonicus TaxID=307972 RepID=A0A2G8KWM4_STIJA|nr:putative nucleolar complex protein 3-like [Apostichopus japonicus]
MTKGKGGRSSKGAKGKMSRVKKSNINSNKSRKATNSVQSTNKKDLPIKKRTNSWKGSAIGQSRGKDFGKEKKKVWQKRPESNKIEMQEEGEEESDVDEQYETLQEEEIEYLKKLSQGEFLKGIDKNDQLKSKKSRKSKARNQDNILLDFEKLPRMLEEKPEEERKQVKQMLPIKDAQGLKRQWREAGDRRRKRARSNLPKRLAWRQEMVVPQIDTSTAAKETQKAATKNLPEVSTVNFFAARQQKLAVKKREIAAIASSLTEDPEKYVKKLKTLRLLIAVEDPDIVLTVRKLGMVSMTEVFKDIIPSYRVRDWAQGEETVKLSKEIKEKREYEESLLSNYKRFLEFLEETVTASRPPRRSQKPKKAKKKGKVFEMSRSAKSHLAVVACSCLCDLLLNLAHFNYRVNIISLVVEMMFYRKQAISDASIKYFGYLSAPSDKRDKSRKDENLEEAQKKKQDRKDKMNKMTRTERRYTKRQEALESEQREAIHEQDDNKIIQLNTRVIQSVFATYFRVLKTATDSRLMPSVLEGLAKFAHLINIEFFDDLVKVLNELIGSGALEYRESLHCVLTAFKILSDQGAALNIDPTRFYTHLYMNLFSVHAGESFEDAEIVLKCIDAMVFKRHKQITTQRALAYIKRLGTLSLQSLPNACLAFLSAMRSMLKLYPKTDILLETDTLGSGIFLPELEEPEHCHAQNTVLWELHLLKNHYHPTVKVYANNLLRKAPIRGVGALDPALSKRRPLELFQDFDPSTMVFNPPVLTKPLSKVTRSKAYGKRNFDEFLQPDFQLLADEYLNQPMPELEMDTSSKKEILTPKKEGIHKKMKKELKEVKGTMDRRPQNHPIATPS